MMSGEIDRIGGGNQKPPPDFYFEIEAAKLFGISFLELQNHPEKFELMEMYEVYLSGKNEGEMGLQLMIPYWKKVKEHSDKVQDAQKKAGFR